MKKREHQPMWYKTYDYLSGYMCILGHKFTSKGAAINYARSRGLLVIPRTTVPLTDLEYENLVLKHKPNDVSTAK